MKSNCFPLKDNGKEKIIKEKGNKKVKIIGYKELSKEDFAEPFYFNNEEFNKMKKLIQKKNKLFNFVESEEKNKNLQIYEEVKFDSKTKINNNNNSLNNNRNRKNYYFNRKFSTIIFDHFHKLNLTYEQNCNKTVANKFYFCTKISFVDASKKKKKLKREKKSKIIEKPKYSIRDFFINKSIAEMNSNKIININQSDSNNNKIQENIVDKNIQNPNKTLNNQFKDYFNETTKDFKRKNNFKLTYTSQIKNKTNNISKNEIPRHSRNNNGNFYPRFSSINNNNYININSISQIKKHDSLKNSKTIFHKANNNYIYYKIKKEKNKINQNKIITDKSDIKKEEKKEILKNPIIKENKRIKSANIFLQIKKRNESINNINKEIKKDESKFKTNQTFFSNGLNLHKNYIFYNNKENEHKIEIKKNKSSLNFRNQQRNKNDFPLFNITNFNSKDIKNNFIKYIHYCNDTLCTICHPPSTSKNDINKYNTTQITKTNTKTKNNSNLNSCINQNKKENKYILRNDNSKKNLVNKKEYNKIIRKRIFNSLYNRNGRNITKKVIRPNIEEINLRKYESEFVDINEYFK